MKKAAKFSINNKINYSYNIVNNRKNIINSLKGYPNHFVPAVKEWKDSVYTYNKKYLKHVIVNNNWTNKLTKSYFFFNNLKTTARSKRMRTLIEKKSDKIILVSKPFIKHNNDKVIINVYTFNKQKQFLIKKLFFYKRKQSFFKLWLKNNSLLTKINRSSMINLKKIKLNNRSNLVYNNIIKNFYHGIKSGTNKKLSLYGLKYNNELAFIKNRLTYMFKEFTFFKHISIYIFLSKILFLFKIKTIIPIFKNNKINPKNIIKNKSNILILFNNKLIYINSNKLNEDLIYNLLSKYKNNYTKISFINRILFNFIEQNYINKNIITKSNFIDLYNSFNNKYNNKLLIILLKKNRILYYLTRLWFNNFKFYKLISGLKLIISKIYNKKIEFNITNLKYSFLNSDIYNQVIINKAIKDISILKVLGACISLTKIPTNIMHLNKEKNKLNRFIYKSMGLDKLSINNKLNSVNASPFDKKNESNDKLVYEAKLYPNYFVNKTSVINKKIDNKLNKLNYILNSIKFKWVSGVKIQAAGRLTRRFAAARSVFKFRSKGNFKNTQYFLEDTKLKIMSSLMLRNTVKSNSQYTFIKSRRRIGSFGIKVWTSSY